MFDYNPSKVAWDFPLDPLPSELGMYLTLVAIAAEFESDPMSVQCFDLRVVERTKAVCRQFEAKFGQWMKNNPKEVSAMNEILLGLPDRAKLRPAW